MKQVEEVIININDIEEIFNKFDDNDISDELASYIEKRCSRVQKRDMCIKFITEKELSDEDKEKIVSAIRSHFGLEAKYTMLDNRKSNRINGLLFLLGIIIVVLENLMPLNNTVLTIVDILGCFIMWESCYNLLFTDNEMDRRIDRSKKIIKSKIIFEVKK